MILTGANGFLGSWLARGLLTAGYQVKAIRRSASRMDRVDDIEHSIFWLDIDTATTVELASFLRGGDIVVHTAGNYCRRGETVSEAVESNVLFGLKLLEAAISAEVNCFINTATSLPSFTNTYTRSKAQFSEWGISLSSLHPIVFIDVLLEHMYGPGDDGIKFVEHVILSCVKNEPVLELTQGTQLRDFICISDVVAGYLKIIENWCALGASGRCKIPLGSGEVVSVRSLVEMVHMISGSSTLLRFGARSMSPTEVMYSCADTSILKSLGWCPKITLEEGLYHTIREQLNLYKIH